jgi:hypothetical protein
LSASTTADVLSGEAIELGALFGIELAESGAAPSSSAAQQAGDAVSPAESAKSESPREKQRTSAAKKKRTPQADSAQKEQLIALRRLLRRLQNP